MAIRTAISAFALAVFALASPVVALPLLTIDNLTGPGLGNPPFTLGWQFTTNTDVEIIALGLFDSSQDGFAESHDVGLWNQAGTLLASTTFGAGLAGTLVNQFRYNSIVPVPLSTGQIYRVGALFTSRIDPLVFDGNNVQTDPSITYNGARFASGAALSDPVVANSNNGYFGPNLQGQTRAVPEPASLLVLGIGAAFVACLRWKHHA